MALSLFERLGGEEAIMAAVDIFYARVLADPLVAPFFADLNMQQQTKKQVSFMAAAFGAPEKFQGRDLRTAHAKLVKDRGLGDVHFDAIAGHLQATLSELAIEPALIQEALTVVAGTRNEVLGR